MLCLCSMVLVIEWGGGVLLSAKFGGCVDASLQQQAFSAPTMKLLRMAAAHKECAKSRESALVAPQEQ